MAPAPNHMAPPPLPRPPKEWMAVRVIDQWDWPAARPSAGGAASAIRPANHCVAMTRLGRF
ncbi:hypothetical protein KOR34_08510 [Posidoniimonas corsicana]|uniref:Uncharacterized protein n=1 Tax=Posidoniimonas corsicana TaxID=1938618 RepID=A0A5C5VBF4_9BACT|nr:hypothetical protein [Posidoniimonas corsicana]TWT35954.1 hypothetical protein KOR34_08510 [Posidoniimonas corsicana]